MTDRCEPPPELRERDGWHWVQAGERAAECWRWTSFGRYWQSTTAMSVLQATSYGYRYLSPVLTPAEVEALRAAAYRAGAEAMREECAKAAGFAAWKHEGDDAYSRGMDAGAVQQVRACVDSIRALPLPAGGSGWQPIATAPRDGKPILCYAPETSDGPSVTRVDYWWVQERAFAHMRPARPYTHWQPLPAAPEEGG